MFVDVHFFAGPLPAALTLPSLHTPAAETAGVPIDGTWTVGQGSLAGYRVHEEFLGQGNSIVARTSAVTGTVLVVHGDVSAATFRVDLATAKANGKTQPQLAGIMNTANYPDATFTLTTPIVPSSAPAINKPIEAKVTGPLTMHGAIRTITFETTARRNGSLLEAVRSIPVTLSNWDIHTPTLLQHHGVLEFLLILHQ